MNKRLLKSPTPRFTDEYWTSMHPSMRKRFREYMKRGEIISEGIDYQIKKLEKKS